MAVHPLEYLVPTIRDYISKCSIVSLFISIVTIRTIPKIQSDTADFPASHGRSRHIAMSHSVGAEGLSHCWLPLHLLCDYCNYSVIELTCSRKRRGQLLHFTPGSPLSVRQTERPAAGESPVALQRSSLADANRPAERRNIHYATSSK